MAVNADPQAVQLALPLGRRDKTATIPYLRGSFNETALRALGQSSDSGEPSAASPLASARMLAVVGPIGVGKSRLLALFAKTNNAEVLRPDEAGALAIPEEASAIVIDDAHRAAALDLFNLYNVAAARERPFLISGAGRIEAWGQVGADAPLPDLVSRLSALPIARLEAPDIEAMTLALNHALRVSGLSLPETVIADGAARLCRRFSAVDAVAEAAVQRAEQGHYSAKALLEAAIGDNPDHIL